MNNKTSTAPPAAVDEVVALDDKNDFPDIPELNFLLEEIVKGCKGLANPGRQLALTASLSDMRSYRKNPGLQYARGFAAYFLHVVVKLDGHSVGKILNRGYSYIKMLSNNFGNLLDERSALSGVTANLIEKIVGSYGEKYGNFKSITFALAQTSVTLPRFPKPAPAPPESPIDFALKAARRTRLAAAFGKK